MKAPETRDDLLDQLAEVGRMAVGGGLALASGGNLSARLPGSDEFVVTGAGTWLDRLTPEDFSVMTLDGASSAAPSGRRASGSCTSGPTGCGPTSTRSSTCTRSTPSWSTPSGHPIRLITLDHAYYVRSVGTVPYFPNGSDELADGAAEQAREHDCVVLSHHGCSALGADVGMAYRRALNLEEAATATYRCLAVGDTGTTFPPAAFADLHHA